MEITQATKELYQRLEALCLEFEGRLPKQQSASFCPLCNESVGYDGDEVFLMYDVKSNTAVSMNTGPWNAADWKELIRCTNCGNFSVAENSNY